MSNAVSDAQKRVADLEDLVAKAKHALTNQQAREEIAQRNWERQETRMDQELGDLRQKHEKLREDARAVVDGQTKIANGYQEQLNDAEMSLARAQDHLQVVESQAATDAQFESNEGWADF